MTTPVILPVFVINLASATQRRTRMEHVLRGQGVAFEVVDAVDGSALGTPELHFWHDDPMRAKLNPGEIGCLLSHCKIWQRIVDEGLPGAIILEDDLCFAPDFAEITPALGEAVSQLGLVRLEADRRAVIVRRESAARVGKHQCHLMRRDGPLGSGAYALSQAVAAKLLAALPKFTNAIDAELFAASRSTLPELKTYQLAPSICMQAQFDQELARQEPFLASKIATMGERADHKLGLKPKQRRFSRLRALAPLHRRIREWQFALSGWQRLSSDPQDWSG